jgi:hypothetical protein
MLGLRPNRQTTKEIKQFKNISMHSMLQEVLRLIEKDTLPSSLPFW